MAQAGFQAAALGLTLVIAIVSGVVTGFILRLPVFEQIKNEDELFEDHLFWEIPTNNCKESIDEEQALTNV